MKWPSLTLTALLLVPSAVAEETPTDVEAQFKEISNALVCQCGCNKLLTICEMQGCHSATPMREEIREKLARGETKQTILDDFVDRYGLVVLSAPPTSGFHLSAWIMPFVVLVIGALIAKKVLSSWRHESRQTSGAAATTEVSAAEQSRIERELRDFDA